MRIPPHDPDATPPALVRLRVFTCGQPTRPSPATWQHGCVTAATHSTLFPQTPDSADAVLEGLDPEQREVATALHGPVCVLAGAGTGKTRAITHRIAYGVRAGILQPSSVLAVTFTNRAAGEMRGRLRQLGAGGVQARTFHSAALRQLQYFWPKAIGGSMPRLVDRKIQLVADAAAACRIRLDRGELRDVTGEIEWSKVTQTVPADYPLAAAKAGREAPRALAEIAQLYSAYEDLKRDRALIDFEDVLLPTVAVLQDRHDVADQVRSQYQHFVVDEYQDVSPLQQRLLEPWLGDRDNLCVVGDASQTIYSFTGATPDHLLDFRTRHPGATVVKLVRDYRSTPQVVHLANRLLAQAHGRAADHRLELVSQRAPGQEPVYSEYPDEPAEAEGAARRIRELMDAGVRASEIATRCEDCPSDMDEGLYERLREWRAVQAQRSGQPAFCVFTDKTLMAIAEAAPDDDGKLARIPGAACANSSATEPMSSPSVQARSLEKKTGLDANSSKK
ncbi:DNA 3'-5' helicase OS=Streptomyces alboniger OX=132473 GN=CP975_23600 PE=3 SV=1 [Streptomyces alboniger]